MYFAVLKALHEHIILNILKLGVPQEDLECST